MTTFEAWIEPLRLDKTSRVTFAHRQCGVLPGVARVRSLRRALARRRDRRPRRLVRRGESVAARVPGGRMALLALLASLLLLTAVVTAVLTLDTAVVLMTPVH